MKFNKEARKILKKSAKGKQLIRLLEESPRTPLMKGLPKVHKQNVPMRPIISGIGSAPHKIAKILAKPLSRSLGLISGTHLKNSSDLMERLKTVDMKNKKLASLDVKSLFTNVPVPGALIAIKHVVDMINKEELPLPKSHYLKLHCKPNLQRRNILTVL